MTIKEIEARDLADAVTREKVLPGYRAHIESMLARGDWNQLHAWILQEDVRRDCMLDTDLAYMVLSACIYGREKAEGVSGGIYQGIHSVGEMEDRLRAVKFALWRLEFLDQGDLLLELMASAGVSIPMLTFLVQSVAFDEKKLWAQIARLTQE